jgi:hypothetical protein
MPEHEPEQELGPKLADAFQHQADRATDLRGSGLAAEARRRVRKRRQGMTMAAAAVVVAAAIGGVWSSVGDSPTIASNASDSQADRESAGSGTTAAPGGAGPTGRRLQCVRA